MHNYKLNEFFKKNKNIIIIGIIFSILIIFFGVLRLLFYYSGIGGYIFIFYGLIGIFPFMIFNRKREYKKNVLIIFTICYFVVGSGLMSAYLYTHTQHTDGIVPPTIYVRVLDNEGNPVRNAECIADLKTENFVIEDKLLENIEIMKELVCYGREKCDSDDYFGYYKLNVTNQSYEAVKFLFLTFYKQTNVVKGDFEINIVCRTSKSVSYTIINQTNFPCSPIPLTGNYVAPSYVCSDKNDLIQEYFYDMSDEEFDEYDVLAINFLKKNYQNKTVLSNNKIAIKLDDCDAYKAYSCGIKPVGMLQDKKGYGDPYVFNEFMIGDCERRLELINKFNIDVILSRFELDKCDFMKEVYSNKDYIYEIG